MAKIYWNNCMECDRRILAENLKPTRCSLCKKEYLKEQFNKKAVKCKVCSKKYIPSKGQKTCSPKCRDKTRDTRVELYCSHCRKKIIRTRKSLSESGNNFCSIKCSTLFRRERSTADRFAVTPKTRELLLDTFGEKCPLCGKEHERLTPLNIHHLNEDSKDNRIKNLAPICNSCHCKVHFYGLNRKQRQTIRSYL